MEFTKLHCANVMLLFYLLLNGFILEELYLKCSPFMLGNTNTIKSSKKYNQYIYDCRYCKSVGACCYATIGFHHFSISAIL